MDYFLCKHLTAEEKEGISNFVMADPHGCLIQHPEWTHVVKESRIIKYLFFWGGKDGKILVSAMVKRHISSGLGWAKDIVFRGPVCSQYPILRAAILKLTDLLQSKGSVYLKLNSY